MKFSLFFEMQIANPTRKGEARLFQDCVEQAILADQLGYHCVWSVEHHGLYEYAHSSAPEIFLSFVAARTRKIRVGHGVCLTPTRFNHPIRVAERVATLDILSQGRVNWGSGKSSSNLEPELFEIDRSDLQSQWEEALEMIPQMWQQEVFSWSGKHYRIRETQVVPKPLQQPHPPMFSSSSRPQAMIRLAEMGLGVLNFSMATHEELKQQAALYKQTIARANPKGRMKTNVFAVTANTCVLDDDNEACHYGFQGARYFQEAFGMYYKADKAPAPGPLPVNRRVLPSGAVRLSKRLRFDKNTEMRAIIGDPGLAREKVAMFAEAGVDELILVMQLGLIPNEVVLRSVRCFGEKVMPYFSAAENNYWSSEQTMTAAVCCGPAV